jgi:hypothetical protein
MCGDGRLGRPASAEPSGTRFGPEATEKYCRASLDRTAEGGCPHILVMEVSEFL